MLIFHTIKSTPYRDVVSAGKGLPYSILSTHMKDLGFDAGFEEELTTYCLRRAAANAIDRKL